MAVYRYVAVEPSAARIEGRMEAISKSAVVERLRASGHVPIRVDEIGSTSLANFDLALLFGKHRVSRRALALITGQLATLLHAGLPLDEALVMLAELVDDKNEKQCVTELLKKVRSGASLADALAAQDGAFPEFFISMVRAGEAGASLERVLARLAEFLERTQAAKEHIKSALLYPLIVTLVCCASIGILFIFVVPRFRPLFEQAGNSLPASAQLLLSVSGLFQNFWYVFLLVPTLAAVVLYRQMRDPRSRQKWDRLVLQAPLLGELVRKSETVSFSRTLGTLLRNGVPLLQALAITRETLRNTVFSQAMDRVIELV